MSDGGGAYIEAWISRLRMQRQKNAPSLVEADRMRCEDSRAETQARLIVLVVAVLVVIYNLI